MNIEHRTSNIELRMNAKVIDMTDGPINKQNVGAATWIDPDTGLEWQCESPGQMNWHAAQSYVRSLSITGKVDWRLPTARELETLLDRTIYRPAFREKIPLNHRQNQCCRSVNLGVFERNDHNEPNDLNDLYDREEE